MIVVSDSSPLVTLSKLGHFGLLRLLFERVYIPPEVHHEVVVAGAGLPGSAEVRTADWIELRVLRSSSEQKSLLRERGLGPGELGALALAKELGANLVLLDDLAARSAARTAGLRVLGTLGVLETSFLRGYLPDLREVIAQFKAYGYIDKDLLNIRLRALHLAPLPDK